MPDNEILAKLKQAVDAQKRVQTAAKGLKAEIDRLKSEAETK